MTSYRSFLLPLLLSAFLLNASWTNRAAAEPRTLTIRYAALVDRSQMIRTGQTVGEALHPASAAALKGALQPFLDPFSSLLPEAIEMENPSMTPFRPVQELYPSGGREPAWVGIVRGGRVAIQTDGLGRVRLFLPGSSGSVAYSAHYPVIRHCLAALAASCDGPITVEVYSYRHDYARSEFVMQRKPFVRRERNFPPPAHLVPLDLERIESFFSLHPTINGAEIDSRSGLVLLGSHGATPMLDGRPATLADLAVAYRAVFHAGDNAAFISLDPHPDPTLSTVNFGGYLENTSIGRVVLAADKRFKTITTGMDPDSYRDLRDAIAQAAPGFISSSERDLGSDRSGSSWIGTRFWFYPETVEIETEADYASATIGRARFRADAERQRGDFASGSEFERFRAAQLSPSIRRCIDDLNADYDRYAALFPELQELSTVARLLGVCAWLKKRPARDVDLDALLAVSLPPATTPASRTQMLAAVWRSEIEGYVPPGENRPFILCFSPQLDRRIDQFFSSNADLAQLLGMMLAEANKPRTGQEEARAATLRSTRGAQPVRTLLRTKEDVQAFARYMTQREAPNDTFARGLDDRYRRLVDEINAIQNAVAAGTPATPEMIEQHTRLASEANSLAALSGRPIRTSSVISIGGGINLGPDDFRIRVRPRRSSSGGSTRRATSPPRTPPVSSRTLAPARPTPPPPAPPPQRPTWTQLREEGAAGAERRRLSGTRVTADPTAASPSSVTSENYWFRRTAENGSWSDRRVSGDAAVERSYRSAENSLTVTRSSPGRNETLVARRERSGAIVFQRATPATTPGREEPAWWNEEGAPQ